MQRVIERLLVCRSDLLHPGCRQDGQQLQQQQVRRSLPRQDRHRKNENERQVFLRLDLNTSGEDVSWGE